MLTLPPLPPEPHPAGCACPRCAPLPEQLAAEVDAAWQFAQAQHRRVVRVVARRGEPGMKSNWADERMT